MLKYILPAICCCHTALAAETYDVRFSASFQPAENRVAAAIEVRQSNRQLRVLDFSAPEARFNDFRGDGVIERRGKRLVWALPPKGGRLEYRVQVDHRRGERFDARLAPDWAILRLDDVFPAARAVSLKGTESQSTVELKGPQGWTFESRYGRVSKRHAVDNPERRFDRPTGWLAAGHLGVRREWIGKRRIVVAGPQGHDLRRLDIIAFLRWTLPKLTRVFPDFPQRLLIVGAHDDMWRGGLSGPGSIYLHSTRPLISENGTSTLLHELLHVVTGSARGPREDWVVEGLAEYYSLEILRRSGGLSPARYQQAFERLADWARRENGALRSPSTGADTARAALLFRDLQAELERSDVGGLDPVARGLLEQQAVDGDSLRALVEEALGGRSATLRRALPAPGSASP